ncbi:MAG: DUF805 domain-containing protein [Patescibacteria group bacterium]|nr:DUF805 domain-containing protein [Patescibacteria group bacterium]MDD5121514.1 DUF805 domain-containing protein [Patescibacteria group bacterium]MDD5221844.1 DUF805 domain-containing protein [Patescibacteria group bacterium]MDD5396324.1 DUF805 domain-containing protein [Patescibacteria group bacterium]
MKYYLMVIRNYLGFSGRASRKEYWNFVLWNFIIGVLLGIIAAIIGDKDRIINLLYGLAVLTPSLAVGARRLHDINFSGWWLLLGLIPFIGAIILAIFALKNSQPGDNKYGSSPKVALITTENKAD